MILSVIALCSMFGVIGCILDKKITELEKRVERLEKVYEIGVD